MPNRVGGPSDMARVTVPADNQKEVFLLSRRRCCICFGLDGDLGVKQGQIAHLDHDNTNYDLDNLAFLCLPHHDQYDSTTSQSKGLREGEVKGFRKELYDRIVAGLVDESVSAESKPRLANPVSEKPGQVARAEDKQEILPNIGSLRPQTIHVTHDDESDIWLKSNL